jgi:hypothetical protein
MAKTALLIGSQVAGLQGVEHDVAAMAAFLEEMGFTLEICCGPNATRKGILAQYGALIHHTGPADAIVVYYAGHGGLAMNPEYRPLEDLGVVTPRYHQFIVPVDMEETNDEDFRGITSLELSQLLSELTCRSTNVTLILDCCHSARMSRDASFVPRALPRPWFVGVASHLEKLKNQGVASHLPYLESNPHAVRLVATGPLQSSYEYINGAGQWCGLFTESLILALQAAKDLPVSWHMITQRVRERVASLATTQRPEVEGPMNRLPFAVATCDAAGVLSLRWQAGKPVLDGGRLLGVEIGDEYMIMPTGSGQPDATRAIARATVSGLHGVTSEINLDFCSGHQTVPAGARAFPMSTLIHKQAVRLNINGSIGREMHKLVEGHSHLKLAAEGDLVFAEIEESEGNLILKDRAGLLLVEPRPPGPGVAAACLENLAMLARAEVLRGLQSGDGENKLGAPYAVEWGNVVGGKPAALPPHGAILGVGEHIYARVFNQGPAPVYVSIFDVGLGGKITLLTTSEPAGIVILPGQDYVLGAKEYEGLVGLRLAWAAGIPRDTPRSESLVVILTDTPQDLRALETKGIRAAMTSGPRSQLQQLISQVAWGGKRDLSLPEESRAVRYAVHPITFLVDPCGLPARADDGFIIDERPDPSILMRFPRSFAKPPAKVAVRLTDLIVHRNRALFSSEIRVDALVVTCPGTKQETEFYRSETTKFSGIHDGDRLPFENLLVYFGPVKNFLDIAVWVSRDQKGSLSLAEMFKTQVNSVDFKEAAVTLGTLVLAAPEAAAIAAALGAGATLINLGYQLLSQAVGKSIGLYRTSLLAQEGFGVGRHPKRGVMRAQDFSFAYEIVAM